MQLQVIERLVLANIKYDDYTSLAESTDAQKMLDFEILHYCVWLAREEIKFGCYIPAVLKHGTQITVSSGTKEYTISDTDVDLIESVRYKTTDDEYPLVRRNYNNILEVVSSTSTSGTPVYYIPFGSGTTGLPKIELFPVPSQAGEYVNFDYKPVLSNLSTATDEDVIMRKFPLTVVKIASAYAFQYLKNDKDNLAGWLTLGRADFKEINLMEIGADYRPDTPIDAFVQKKRNDRYTR